MKDGRYGVLINGAGWVATQHVQAFKQNPHADIVAISSLYLADAQRLADVKFKCRGCPTAIACASVMTELALGADLNEASEITDETVEDALGGLPESKRHCSNLAASALYEAILDHILRGADGARRAQRADR